MSALPRLRERLAEITDLRQTTMLLFWDQQVMMPRAGGAARAEHVATLEKITHERFTSAETGELLAAAAAELNGADPESDDACLVRRTQHDFDKESRVPGALRAEMARASALGEEAWVTARSASDFAAFAPALARNLDLRREYVTCFDVEQPYDALLDDFEEGMTTAETAAVFATVRDRLVPLLQGVAANAGAVDDSCLEGGGFDVDRQRALVRQVVQALGWTEDGWRLDDAVHPFAIGVDRADVRVTTRYEEATPRGAIYAGVHEMGHGLYEHQIPASLARTPLGTGVSLGLHESQSRMWENLVGRSRPFVRWLHPRLEAAFPDKLRGVDPEGLYRAVNKVAPSFIRVEADEATYSLHVILRFELEQELIEERLAVADIPDAWNARMQEYLGITPPDDAQGCLQDVHWAAGMIGYFPTYALGNVMAAQIWARASEELGDMSADWERGEFGALREWLGTNLHALGRKFTPRETLERVAGAPLDPEPYCAYLEGKFGELYGLA